MKPLIELFAEATPGITLFVGAVIVKDIWIILGWSYHLYVFWVIIMSLLFLVSTVTPILLGLMIDG